MDVYYLVPFTLCLHSSESKLVCLLAFQSPRSMFPTCADVWNHYSCSLSYVRSLSDCKLSVVRKRDNCHDGYHRQILKGDLHVYLEVKREVS